MSGGFRLALGLLTIIPVRPPEAIGRREARTAMLLAPLAVVPITAVAAGLGWAALLLGLPWALAGVVVVGALTVGNRAMHLDGLADTVDGLGSGRDAAGALEIMKRGDVGPMGTVALVLVLLAQVLASGVLLQRPGGWLQLAALLAISRGALALGCLPGLPAARPGGLGALVAGSVPVPAASLLLVLLGAVAVAAGFVTGSVASSLVALPVALVAVWWLLVRCRTRFGGITGDVLGAVVEVAATSLLVVSAA